VLRPNPSVLHPASKTTRNKDSTDDIRRVRKTRSSPLIQYVVTRGPIL
jgi:hypothetical protein